MDSGRMDFVNLLEERRKDCDLMWVSRSMQPLTPHKLPPELIYTRKQTIQATLQDTRVLAVINSLASDKNLPESTLVAQAQDMLYEMASKAKLPTVRWIGLLITKVLKRILISIHLNEIRLFRIQDQMRLSQVQYVYTPTHRSYLDFILLSYILFSYDMALPNIASGMDFYRMKIVGELLRHTGAFYMRRSFSSDPLYKEIFRSYVSSLVTNSDRALEFFIEGTRSRSQKTLTPKFGLLSTILEGLHKSRVPDIQFIPISISYDKPLEELLFVYELLGVPKPAESTTGLFRSLSILREPFAHGHVYVNIAPPISARDYVDLEARKASTLTPYAKLDSEITKKVAYAIIDCHKRNTVLTPFNIVSLLFNNRLYTDPAQCYLLNELIDDYHWMKSILIKKFQAVVHPAVSNVDATGNQEVQGDVKFEILESLETHKNLMVISGEQNLKLSNRHVGVTHASSFKGFPLSEETLKISVPVINLMIYVNPVFAYLSKPALVAVCLNAPSKERAVQRYLVLRSLFSNEFALSPCTSESETLIEFEETIEILKNYSSDNVSKTSQLNNCKKLETIFCNLLSPFIASLYTLCKTLEQWDASVMCVEKNIIKECQRRVELELYQECALTKHPYSLCLDTYASLLSSLVTCGNVTLQDGIYKANKINLQAIIVDLEDTLKESSSQSFSFISCLQILQEIPNFQAKL